MIDHFLHYVGNCVVKYKNNQCFAVRSLFGSATDTGVPKRRRLLLHVEHVVIYLSLLHATQ